MLKKKTDEPSHPVFSAETDPRKYDLYFDLAKSKDNWRKAFFICAALLLLVTCSFTIMAFSVKWVPYGIVIDDLGRTIDMGPLEELRGNDERLLRAQLIEWLKDIRTISSDPYILEGTIEEAFTMLTADVAGRLNQEFSLPENDPRNLARQWRRTVQVSSLIPTDDTRRRWKIEWVETLIPVGGGSTHRTAWEAFLTLEFHPPTRKELIPINPLGIYLTELNWGPITPSNN